MLDAVADIRRYAITPPFDTPPLICRALRSSPLLMPTAHYAIVRTETSTSTYFVAADAQVCTAQRAHAFESGVQRSAALRVYAGKTRRMRESVRGRYREACYAEMCVR